MKIKKMKMITNKKMRENNKMKKCIHPKDPPTEGASCLCLFTACKYLRGKAVKASSKTS
jgi:hypothetical protein